MILRALALVIALLTSLPAAAEIRLPKLFTDHGVLQRERPIHIWGWATPGKTVDVRFHAQHLQATADRLGTWHVWLAPEAAGGPYTLQVSGDAAEGSRTVSDLLVGDVWFASGQSNMEMPLNGFPGSATVQNAAAEIAAATNPRLRLLRIEHAAADHPLDDIQGQWTTCNPDTAAQFSAVAYFFAREIAARERVPVGIIDSTWGGTPADSWVSLEGLAADPSLYPAFAARAAFARDLAQVPAMLAAEKRETEAAAAAGNTTPAYHWHPQPESWAPAGLFNAMVAPFTRYAIKGIIWYQGETNSGPERAPFYADLFQGLIADWRHQFAQGQLPFLFAQISSFDSPQENWGMIRDAQRRALALGNTGMAVTLDIGDPTNVHPSDKQTVGARLALAARAIVYGENLSYSGPRFRQVTGAPGGLRVWFDHAEGLASRGPLVGFEIAGSDRRFVPATAALDQDTVVVTSAIAEPRFVRYNWANVAPGRLHNAAGLPASTFTSEERIVGHLTFP